jgi:ABC-type branched-subunit amino acid transport system substrate-binding protein
MGGSGRGGGVRATLATVVAALGLAACSSGGTTSSQAPGVTAHTIDVGAIANESGTGSGDDAAVVDGVRAYFDQVNAAGGVAGRRLVLGHVADDGGSAAGDLAAARELVSEDHVFAIVGVATPTFAAASYLAGTATPTFGEASSGNWAGPANLFGVFGSASAPATDATAVAWAAGQVGATSAAVVADGSDARSVAACRADAAALRRAKVAVPVADYRFSPGGSPDDDVFQMAADHVELLVSCLQEVDTLHFEQVMKSYHLANDVVLWLSGYSAPLVTANAAALQRAIFILPHVPVQVVPAYARQYPGMVGYVDEMTTAAPQAVDDEAAFDGWVAAAQFVAGLRAVGRDLSQGRLVAAVNAETDFTAGGLMAPVDWRSAHHEAQPPYCRGFVEVYDGQSVPALLGPGGQALRCFAPGSPKPVPAPAGTPGPAGGTGT